MVMVSSKTIEIFNGLMCKAKFKVKKFQTFHNSEKLTIVQVYIGKETNVTTFDLLLKRTNLFDLMSLEVGGDILSPFTASSSGGQWGQNVIHLC